MKQYKELLKDFGILSISNFASKILIFLLVPLYTSILSTEDYGNYDIVSTTVSLLVPILTLCIGDGVVRFLLDKKNNSAEVISIAYKITLVGVLVFVALLLLNNIFNIVPVFNDFIIYFALLFCVNIFYKISESVTRGLYRLKDIAISGLISSALTIALNILFLLVLRLGLDGYFLANIIAIGLAGIFLFVKTGVPKCPRKSIESRRLRKDMLKYSRPLVLNEIGWWINNVSDRYIVSMICGIATNGIYSVAYKIPSILSMVQSIFNQAWTISAIKNLDSKNREKYIHAVYSTYNALMVLICSLLIIFAKIIAAVLFKDEFFAAWEFTPFLLISVIFGSMSGIIGGVLSALKKTATMGWTTFIGALVNTVLNIILVMNFGAMGAAVSTMVAFFLVWLLRYGKLKKEVNVKINIPRDMVAYILLLAQGVILLSVNGGGLSYLLNFVIFAVLVVLYWEDMTKIMRKVKNGVFGRKVSG